MWISAATHHRCLIGGLGTLPSDPPLPLSQEAIPAIVPHLLKAGLC